MTQFGVAPSGPMSRQPSRPTTSWPMRYAAAGRTGRRKRKSIAAAYAPASKPCRDKPSFAETMATSCRVAEKHGYTVTDLKSDRRFA